MPKKSKTIREWTKGLNTYFSPRDVPDESLTKNPVDGEMSVGIYNDKGGIIRLCGQGFDNYTTSAGNDTGTSFVINTKSDGTNKTLFYQYGTGAITFNTRWNIRDAGLQDDETEYIVALESGQGKGIVGHVYSDDESADAPSRTFKTNMFNAYIGYNSTALGIFTNEWFADDALRVINPGYNSGYISGGGGIGLPSSGINWGRREQSDIFGTEVDMKIVTAEPVEIYPPTFRVSAKHPLEKYLTNGQWHLMNKIKTNIGTDGVNSYSWNSSDFITDDNSVQCDALEDNGKLKITLTTGGGNVWKYIKLPKTKMHSISNGSTVRVEVEAKSSTSGWTPDLHCNIGNNFGDDGWTRMKKKSDGTTDATLVFNSTAHDGNYVSFQADVTVPSDYDEDTYGVSLGMKTNDDAKVWHIDNLIVTTNTRLPWFSSGYWSTPKYSYFTSNYGYYDYDTDTSTLTDTKTYKGYVEKGSWIDYENRCTHSAYRFPMLEQYEPPNTYTEEGTGITNLGINNPITVGVQTREPKFNDWNAGTIYNEHRPLTRNTTPASAQFIDFGYKYKEHLESKSSPSRGPSKLRNQTFLKNNHAYIVASTLCDKLLDDGDTGSGDYNLNTTHHDDTDPATKAHGRDAGGDGHLVNNMWAFDDMTSTGEPFFLGDDNADGDVPAKTEIKKLIPVCDADNDIGRYVNIIVNAMATDIELTEEDEDGNLTAASDVGWFDTGGNFNLYMSYVYDGHQESEAVKLGVITGLTTDAYKRKLLLSTAVTWARNGNYDANPPVVNMRKSSWSATITNKRNYLMNPRLTGYKIYWGNDYEASNDIFLMMEVDFQRGAKQVGESEWTAWQCNDDKNWYGGGGNSASEGQGDNSHNYLISQPGSHKWFNIDTPSRGITYQALNGCAHNDKKIYRYNHNTIFQGRNYVGGYYDSNDGRWIYSGVARSNVGQLDNIPSRAGKVNMIGDYGEDIQAIESYGSRLFVFTRTKVIQLDFSNPEIDGRIENTMTGMGIRRKSQVCNTSNGLFWVNDTGAYYYGSQTDNKVVNLIEGKIDIDDWDIGTYDSAGKHTGAVPSIGYFPKANKLVILKSLRAIGTSYGAEGKVWFFDLQTMSWSCNNSLHHTTTTKLDNHTYNGEGSFPNLSNNRTRSKFLNTQSGDLIYLTSVTKDPGNGNATDLTASAATHNMQIKKWNDASIYNQTMNFTTKEFDFGNPHTLKKVYQIYVTYRLGAHDTTLTDEQIWEASSTAWQDMDIRWNRSVEDTGLSTVSFGVDSGDLEGEFDNGLSVNLGDGFTTTTSHGRDNWSIAELVPSKPINCYTLQLSFKGNNPEGSGDGVSGSFEINDLTFVYREKRIKSKMRR